MRRPRAWARCASWWIRRLLPVPGRPAKKTQRASRARADSAASSGEPSLRRTPSGKLTPPDLTGSFPGQGRRRVMGVLLRGGQVVDPGAGLAGALDVRVHDGLVTEVRAGLAPEGDTVLDVTGRLVLPGLIDLHAHCFAGAADFGPRTDDVARSTGVTTWVDGGSTGAGNFEGMREWVLSRSRVRMFAFLNISAIGLTYLKIGELNHLAYADVDAAVGAARDHADLILGIKVRNQIEIVGEAGLEPPQRAVPAADASGGAAGCVKDLPTTMGKFLSLGMPLPDVVRAVTANPAKAIGRGGRLGTLKPGAVADVAVFELEEGAFDYEDAHGQHITGRHRFVPTLTLRAGEIWWRRPAAQA